MTTTAVPSTTLTVAGTPTVFLPLSTPWPAGTGCTSNLYLHTPVSVPSTFLAWDPLYGLSFVPDAQTCLPPQVSSWWSQSADEAVFTALGPVFACPEAYTAVRTAVVATSLHQTFCCPSQYSLLVTQPNVPKVFPSQCISTAASGDVLHFLTSQGEAGQATATVTMTGPATVFAIPVNGYNLVTSASTHTSQTTTASTSGASGASSTPSAIASARPSATPAPAGRSQLGVYVGASVGAAVAVLLLGTGALLFWRRRRRAAAVHRRFSQLAALNAGPPPPPPPSSRGPYAEPVMSPKEMPDVFRRSGLYELPER